MNIKEEDEPVLQIKPFDNQMKGSQEIHPSLPQPPFSLCLVGPKGSGKSSVIIRLLYGNRKPKNWNETHKHYRFYRKFFTKIYIFSPTWRLDPTTTRCKIPEAEIFEDPVDYYVIVETIIGSQQDDIEEDGKDETDHILMVFSDLAGQKGVFGHAKGIFNTLAFNIRHYNISIVIDTQALRQINPAFRENFSGLILFAGITNRLEIEKIYHEYLGEYSKESANRILEFVWGNSPYNFLFINFQMTKTRRFFKNFNQLVISQGNKSLLE
jgi:GTPase SAR1 family protein